VEKEQAEMFEMSENYNKKRRSGGIRLFIQISLSEFLRPFFETLLMLQIMGNYHNLMFVEILICVCFLNNKAITSSIADL
jgi:hypothetical protein